MYARVCVLSVYAEPMVGLSWGRGGTGGGGGAHRSSHLPLTLQRRSKVAERTAETLQRVYSFCWQKGEGNSWNDGKTFGGVKRRVRNKEGTKWSCSRTAHVSPQATGNDSFFFYFKGSEGSHRRISRGQGPDCPKCPITSTPWFTCRDSAGFSWVRCCTPWHPGAQSGRTDPGSAAYRSRWVLLNKLNFILLLLQFYSSKSKYII